MYTCVSFSFGVHRCGASPPACATLSNPLSVPVRGRGEGGQEGRRAGGPHRVLPLSRGSVQDVPVAGNRVHYL